MHEETDCEAANQFSHPLSSAMCTAVIRQVCQMNEKKRKVVFVRNNGTKEQDSQTSLQRQHISLPFYLVRLTIIYTVKHR